jgi:hypothetical protein
VAQGVGLEFKPQYHKKEEKKKDDEILKCFKNGKIFPQSHDVS